MFKITFEDDSFNLFIRLPNEIRRTRQKVRNKKLNSVPSMRSVVKYMLMIKKFRIKIKTNNNHEEV